jgi:putative flippase GtrA
MLLDERRNLTERDRFMRFLLVGGFAAVVNIAAGALFGTFLPFGVSIILAFCFALNTAFFLNRRYVFVMAAGKSRTGQYIRFALVNVAALAQIWAVSVCILYFGLPLLGVERHAELIAHTIGVLSPIVTSYLAHKRYTFRPEQLSG